jgi:hypothetical protein
MVVVSIVGYALGRLELFVLQLHAPMRKLIFEKSGLGDIGMGVLSTCPRTPPDENSNADATKTAMRRRDISYLPRSDCSFP